MLGPIPSLRYLATVQNIITPRQVKTAGRIIPQLLERQVERQHLIIQALLMLLLEKKVIEEEEFTQWVDYVDGLDGVLDGKLRQDGSPLECPKCRRKNPPSAVTCQYCTARLEPNYVDRRKAEE